LELSEWTQNRISKIVVLFALATAAISFFEMKWKKRFSEWRDPPAGGVRPKRKAGPKKDGQP